MQVVADPDKNMYAKTFVASRGIHTRVRARAIVLETARGKFALVQADLGGVPVRADAGGRSADRRRPASTRDRLLLSATHTHSSSGAIWPVDSTGYAVLGGDLFDPRIFELTAAGHRRVDRGRGRAARAGARRASRPSPVTDATLQPQLRSVPPQPRRPEATRRGARGASIDPDVTVLRVDSRDGQPLGVWSNFAIHPTSFGDGNLLFSGDNAAFAERIAERADRRGRARPAAPRPAGRERLDERQPGRHLAVARAAQGRRPGHRVRAGPATPAPTCRARAWPRASSRAWATAGAAHEPDARARRAAARSSTSTAPPPTASRSAPSPVLGSGGITGPDGFCAPIDGMAGPGQGMKFPSLAGRGLVPSTVPVSVWRIGSLGVAGFPAEITQADGRAACATAIDAASRAARSSARVIAGLSNGYVVVHGHAGGVRRLPLRGLVHAVRPSPGRALPGVRGRR